MQIIFDECIARDLNDRHVVLELETFSINGQNIKTFCVVEKIPIDQITKIDNMRNLHNELIKNYYKRDWNFCEQALEHLQGQWGGELNSFYDIILSKIKTYKNNEPDDNWTGIVNK